MLDPRAMTPAEALRFMRKYNQLLRWLKKRKLKVEDMPPAVATAALELHQRALLAWGIVREEARSE